MNSEPRPEARTTRRLRRRRYVINPHFQWKYAAWLMGAVFSASTTLAVTMLYVMQEHTRAHVLNPRPGDAAEAVRLVVGFGLGFAFLTAAAFGAWSFLLTHRICGPLFVISGYLRELRAGRYPACRPLRKNDEFKELYRQFVETVEALRARRQADLATFEQMLADLVSANPPEHGLGEMGTQLAALLAEVSQNLATLSGPPAPSSAAVAAKAS
ncbi:MAG TPA: hypothetical protein VGM03_03170 [Phycisphaerae bacterium]|jgi:hypothetical protein